MIEGMKVTVDGGELITLCEARATFHDERAAFYKKKVADMPPEDVAQFHKSGNASPVDTMQERIEKNVDNAMELRFVAKHLIRTETYRLDRGDMARLGIVKSSYY